MSADVYTETEIAAPPARVREVFMDFARYSEWTRGGGVKAIVPPPDKPSPQKDDKITVTLGDFTFSPVVLENSESLFRWIGSLPLLGGGTHSFCFKASAVTPGGTTFKNYEKFSGAFGLVVRNIGAAKNKKNFQDFTDALKERVESLG